MVKQMTIWVWSQKDGNAAGMRATYLSYYNPKKGHSGCEVAQTAKPPFWPIKRTYTQSISWSHNQTIEAQSEINSERNSSLKDFHKFVPQSNTSKSDDLHEPNSINQSSDNPRNWEVIGNKADILVNQRINHIINPSTINQKSQTNGISGQFISQIKRAQTERLKFCLSDADFTTSRKYRCLQVKIRARLPFRSAAPSSNITWWNR